MASKSAGGPASRRASNSVVATPRSASASCRQSSIVRTLWPVSRPMSQRKVRKRSSGAVQAAFVALRQQHHHVDVGAGQELAAAVAADGDAARARPVAPPACSCQARTTSASTSARAIAHQRLDRFVRLEASREFAVALDERCAKIGDGLPRAAAVRGGRRRESR